MTSITVTRLWLNVAADPSDARGFKVAKFKRTDSVDLEVRQYAGGRRRVVRKAGGVAAVSLDVELSHPTSDDRAWLSAHVGQLVIVRDPDGGKFAGVYSLAAVDRTPAPHGENMPLQLDEVTHSEAV